MSSDSRVFTSLQRIESATVDRGLPWPGDVPEKRDDGLTIVIVNWNHRAFLPRSLGSALRALEQLAAAGVSGEILVIDDASRDGSQKLLRSVQALYNEGRLRTVFMTHNVGQARLRNIGLHMAAFRHVCMLDADNELVAETLGMLLQTAMDTDAAMVYGNLLETEDGQVIGARSNMPATTRLTRLNYIDAFAILDAPRLLSIGGFTRINAYAPEDWEMTLHLIDEEELIVFVPVVMGYYHKLPLSASRELSAGGAGLAALRRVHAQTGIRDWDHVRVGRVYHPDVGFVDEWDR